MLNPITYTESVISDFLRYQITTYPFTDDHLYAQMRALLNLEETRATPLMRGPYISLSRTFEQGASIAQLIQDGIFHPHMAAIAEHPYVYGHQEQAIRAIAGHQTTLVSTGTGSGKTESFLYPIISRCLELRDADAPAGIVAVIIYPMNALAEDQLDRLRELLAGSGISFGMYIGKTPERPSDVAGHRLPSGSSKADYQRALQSMKTQEEKSAVYPPEERASRDEMRKQPPRILLTNVKQLELLLTRHRDIELFDHAQLEYIVCDEAHTFSGAVGAETACLLRRLRTYCGRTADQTVCVATSATIVDRTRGAAAGRDFALRFFGVSPTNIAMVTEQYVPDIWAVVRTLPPPLLGDPVINLRNVLAAVEADDDGAQLCALVAAITGQQLAAHAWEEELYDLLAANQLIYHLVELLNQPRTLSDLTEQLAAHVGRPISAEELLLWLALGARSRKEKRPFLRPIVHAFVRGIDGAVVTFPPQAARPRLWLSAADALDLPPNAPERQHYRLPVMTCTTCGQHYFIHHTEDFTFFGERPTGGQAIEDRVVWRALAPNNDGKRLILLDRPIAEEEDEEEAVESTARQAQAALPPRHTAPIHFCRYCGALHPQQRTRCDGCGRTDSLLQLFVVRQDPKHPGYLTACIACSTSGRKAPGGFREPARPVRAITVSDVHVLAQNMIHRAERKRLLVFADNRQDAAFQAGWMQDHARRFRLRALMYNSIQRAPLSIGDLAHELNDLLEADNNLSMALIPEVWRVARKEAEGRRHEQERRTFLRLQILRELTTGLKQRIGLEPWGRIQVHYGGLTPDLPVIVHWANRLNLSPADLCHGVAALLDTHRRNAVLLDRDRRIFSQIMTEGSFEVQRGYIPLNQGVPKGLKLQRAPSDKVSRVQQWLGQRAATVAMQKALRWGVPRDEVPRFLEQMWKLLTEDLKLLVPVTFTGWKGKTLPDCDNVYQIDADKLRIQANTGLYRCNTCRRAHVHPTPRLLCMAHHCNGRLQFEPESPDDYDLMVLDQQFEMVRSREHSAQITNKDRDIIERAFKSDSEFLNTLVCTPTLELGVDIGALDSVLMRNVPPLPANYWQRVGRAGRRHRMAVNITYARPASHDRAYFQDPLKLLQGIIHPPRINLRNNVMIEKHVHATVLTYLHWLIGQLHLLSGPDRAEIEEMLQDCFPTQVSGYLFDNDIVRPAPRDVSALTRVLSKHAHSILANVRTAFSQQWPARDIDAVSDPLLTQYIDNMGVQLQAVIERLWRRLQWALDQINRLNAIQAYKGDLAPEEFALRARCENLIQRLKGTGRSSRETEGYDDAYTYGVLAAEGFLPGYGLDTGAVRATAQISRVFGASSPDFDLPRPSSIALREYVPGNLIYANNNRFVPRFYHLLPEAPTTFQVDIANEAVRETGQWQQATQAALGALQLPAVAICDLDMPHESYISDEEDYRFQLAVATYGYERQRHSGGQLYHWGAQTITLRRAVHLRLVNIGPNSLVNQQRLGYPVCTVCGHSRSPFSSEQELASFRTVHQERCHKPVIDVGFFADITADALCIQHCANREHAYSVAEALRIGAATVIDMEVDDLQLLTISQTGQPEVDVLIYDPMPGGSGLLDQMVENWPKVIEAARAVLTACPSQCETACIDCLMTFRNAYYHRYLNRHHALAQLATWGDQLTLAHTIPAQLPTTADTSGVMPVNEAESTLLAMLQRAGFPTPQAQSPIDLGRPLGGTTPDFFYLDPNDQYAGICIYLDGLSAHIHGNPATHARDQQIRTALRDHEYEVIEIPASQLTDRTALAEHFYKIARILLGRQQAKAIRDNPTWHAEQA